MKKTITFLASSATMLSAIPAVAADWGAGGCPYADGYGMMGGSGFGWFGFYLLGLLYLAVAAFIFALIFWGTKKWLLGNSKGNQAVHTTVHKKK